MAGKTLAELFQEEGIALGKVEGAKPKGKPASSMISKIIAKCEADIKAIDKNNGKIPVEVTSQKSGKTYKKRFMWRAANADGKRPINLVIDNHRWENDRWAMSSDDAGASVKATLEGVKRAIEKLDDTHREYLEKDAKAFVASKNKAKGKGKVLKAARKKRH